MFWYSVSSKRHRRGVRTGERFDDSVFNSIGRVVPNTFVYYIRYRKRDA